MRRVLFLLALTGCDGFGDELACRPYPAPALVSETRCYAEVPSLTPLVEAHHYALNAPAWGDGAFKRRWFLLPTGKTIGWRELDSWEMPVGTVLVKEFFADEHATIPLETRFLVRIDDEGVSSDWFGTTYRWREDGLDAELVPEEGVTAVVRGKLHAFPSRGDCSRCHNPVAGGPLGLQTPNVNHGEQLAEMRARGLFGDTYAPAAVPFKMAKTSDEAAPLEGRVRAWLHSNCSHCHRAGAEMGTRAWGPWYLPFEETDLCRGIVPGDPASSPVFQRVLDADAPMPPIASLDPDPLGVMLLGSWIEGLSPCTVEVP